MADSENRIRIHEGSIVLPNGFEDRTTNLFVPADTATQPNLSVARDWLKEGETLAPYIDRQLALLKSRLQGQRLLARQVERLGPETDGMPGERIDTAYRNGAKMVFQRQAAFIVAPGRVLIFTASSAKSFGETFDTFWRNWLDGYRPEEQAPA
ncbi:DcrB-related protein [Burkholderia sp. 4701]|nr:DcrB-related protein [Burkholderia sp. 4701]MXN87032.1 DcrB-related protein [Burkholderia sp. 4812]